MISWFFLFETLISKFDPEISVYNKFLNDLKYISFKEIKIFKFEVS